MADIQYNLDSIRAEQELRKNNLATMGVILSGNETNIEITNTILDIDKPTLDVTARAEQVLTGYKIVDNDYNSVDGTMPEIGTLDITPSKDNQTIPYGRHSGDGIVYGDANLVSSNIKNDTSIFGVDGTLVGKGTALANQVSESATIDEDGTVGTLVEGGNIVITPTTLVQNPITQRTIVDSLIINADPNAGLTVKNMAPVYALDQISDNSGFGSIIEQDTDNIYCIASAGVIRKYRKSDKALLYTGVVTLTDVRTAYVDDNYVYIATPTGDVKINKYNKSDLTWVSAATTSHKTYAIYADADYIFSGHSTNKIVRINQSDMTTELIYSGTFDGCVMGIVSDGTYLYVAAGRYVYKMTKALVLVGQSGIFAYQVGVSATYGQSVITYRDSKLYVTGRFFIKILNASDMSLVYGSSTVLSSGATCIRLSNNIAYMKSAGEKNMMWMMDLDTHEEYTQYMSNDGYTFCIDNTLNIMYKGNGYYIYLMTVNKRLVQ